MTLVSQIIIDAYRESNLISITATPTALEQAEALRLLNQEVADVYGFECGEMLQTLPLGNVSVVSPQGYPWQWPADAFVPLNANVVCNLPAAQTVNLHPDPQDGSRLAVVNVNSAVFNLTLNANGRKIDGNPTLTLTDPTTQKEWIYDSASASWKIVLPLASTDQMPFPSKYDPLFTILLAARLNPRNGVQMDPQSQMKLSQMMKHFKAQYRQIIPQPSELALLLLPGVREERGYYYYGYGNSQDQFNAGYGYPYWGG